MGDPSGGQGQSFSDLCKRRRKEMDPYCKMSKEKMNDLLLIRHYETIQHNQQKALKWFEKDQEDYRDEFCKYGWVGVLRQSAEKCLQHLQITSNGLLLQTEKEILNESLSHLFNKIVMIWQLLELLENQDPDKTVLWKDAIENRHREAIQKIQQQFCYLNRNRESFEKKYSKYGIVGVLMSIEEQMADLVVAIQSGGNVFENKELKPRLIQIYQSITFAWVCLE